MIRVAACTPVYSSISSKCYNSIQSYASLEGFKFECILKKSADLVDVRNALLREAKDRGCHFALFQDNDIYATPEHFMKLYKAKKDIVAGAYINKYFPDLIMAGNYEEGYPGYCPNKFQKLNLNKGVLPVDWSATGYMLINISALDEGLYPWVRKVVHNTPKGLENTGDDIGFCLHMKQAGNIQTHLHTDVFVEHFPRVDEITDGVNGLQLVVSKDDVSNISKGLGELPMKVSRPLLDKLFTQVNI